MADEWQLATKLCETISFEVDHREDEGLFILTDSAFPAKTEEIHHSGAGRFAWLTMCLMNLYESEEYSGEVNFESMFETSDNIMTINKLFLNDIAVLICRDVWSCASLQIGDIVPAQMKYYYDTVIRSYARHQGSQAPINTIVEDMRVNDEESTDVKTVTSYIDALKKIFVIEDSVAWNPNLSSKTAILKSAT